MKTTSLFARLKCGLVLVIFMAIPFIPVTSTIGLLVVIYRPLWFKSLVDKIYADRGEN